MNLGALNWVVLTGRGETTHRANHGADRTFCGKNIPQSAIWTNKPKRQCQDCIASDPRRIFFIEKMLDVLESFPGSKARPNQKVAGNFRKITNRDFDGCIPFLPESFYWHDEVDGDQALIPAYSEPRLHPRLDIRIITLDPTDKRPQLQRVKRVQPQQIRGRVTPFLPFPTEHIVLFADGVMEQRIFGRGGERWVCISADHDADKSIAHQMAMSRLLDMAYGLAEYMQSRWSVYFCKIGSPGIRFPTTPTGARAAFALRDLPEGADRRSALRHWVTEHWRVNSSDSQEDVLVREHLRGGAKFVWNGIHCRITPSDNDMQRVEDAIDDRLAARRDGTDKRRSLQGPNREA